MHTSWQSYLLSVGSEGFGWFRWMGVVPLTRCQPQSAAKHLRSTRALKNDTFFTSSICFTYVIPDNLKKERFLVSRKPAQTINRMCFTWSLKQFSDMYSLYLWILILHVCEAYRNISLAQIGSSFQLLLWEIYWSAYIVFSAVTYQRSALDFLWRLSLFSTNTFLETIPNWGLTRYALWPQWINVFHWTFVVSVCKNRSGNLIWCLYLTFFYWICSKLTPC